MGLNDEKAHKSLKNVHWQTIVSLCQPCEFRYFDHIFTTETANFDAEKYIKEIGHDEIGKFPNAYGKDTTIGINRGPVQQTVDVDQHFEDIQNYYRENVPRDLLFELREG